MDGLYSFYMTIKGVFFILYLEKLRRIYFGRVYCILMNNFACIMYMIGRFLEMTTACDDFNKHMILWRIWNVIKHVAWNLFGSSLMCYSILRLNFFICDCLIECGV